MKPETKYWLKLGILFLALGGLIFSVYKIIKYFIDSNNTKAQITEIETIFGSFSDEEKTSELSTEAICDKIDALKEKNADIIGCIQVKNTNINFPFVQTTDNKYYLNHSLDKTENSAGWAFLDYRNSSALNDRNNIIYGHGRFDLTMFGTMKTMLEEDWLENLDNLIIHTSNKTESKEWQIFSIYIIPTTSDYLAIDFDSDDEALSFFN